MSFPQDSKHFPPVDEQTTFGQQPPLAPSHSQASGSSNDHAAVVEQPHPPPPPTLQQPPPQQPPPAHALASSSDHLMADAPPTYQEAAQHQRSPLTNDPSVPLLSNGHGNGQGGYAAISIPPPPPPAVPYSPSISSEYSVPDPDRARKFNKFWLLFFLVVVVLLFMDDNTESAKCNGNTRKVTKRLLNFRIAREINDYELNISDMLAVVKIVQSPDPDFGNPAIEVDVSASDREYIYNGIRRSSTHHIEQKTTTLSFSRYPDMKNRGCLLLEITMTFPPAITNLKRLHLAVEEGNITMDLLRGYSLPSTLSSSTPLLSSQEPEYNAFQIQNLDLRAITGFSDVRAHVTGLARVGGTLGGIRGELMVGEEMSVVLVEGSIRLNMIQANASVPLVGRAIVAQGDVHVGLPGPYEGKFLVSGERKETFLTDEDPERTHVLRRTSDTVEGWSSALAGGPRPGPITSDLNLQSTAGGAVLSMKRIEL